ncbi:MAG: SH3 domain-containing protein [Lachnospiraceae bacterium]|nr:SH3 domain-containing protein [Lachnospiraceae bacterium]
MKKKMLSLSAVIAVVLAVSLSGCGQRTEEPAPETQKATETEVVTEAATEEITEAQKLTEKETETEAQTETEPATEAVTERDLTSDEEMDEEEAYPASITMYASDDVNIRSTPDTESGDNVISSFDQGEEVTVIGETPGWYVVEKSDFSGYVRKDVLSETAVEPKSPEERAEQSGSSGSETTSVDLEYNVQTYAESFTIQLGSDANLRSAPSSDAGIIGTIPTDTVVTALGSTDEWYKVEFDGTVGYVNRNLIM